MAVTPLIKPIQNQKGIFYTFQSALEDINITLANSENSVRFSKFAMLRIPEIGVPDTPATDNKFQFLAQGETHLIEGLNSDQNINLAQSFQNYALNFEALLISRPQYDREEKLTVSERVFWKWLKEAGAIRFRDANSVEKNANTLGSEKRFVEEYVPNGTYNKVVQYVGDIDVVNTIKSKDNAYTEVYIHVPTNVGSTTHVLFKSVKDSNYFPNMTVGNNPADPLNIEYLSGRKFNEVHPFGLSLKGYYDLDDSSVYSEIATTFGGTAVPSNWFTQNVRNAYYTDNVNGSGEYDIASNQYILKQFGVNTVEYVRNTLDGISIDFDLDNYKLAAENPKIKVFSQFNDYIANKDFQFNAVLIYYDTFDPNNLDANGNPIDIQTNLYGILFLDKVEQNGLEFNLPFITKYKPDPLNKINGNSFSYKLNLKLDTSIENVLVEKSINDFSTFSMDLFLDVITEFKQIQTKLNDRLLQFDSTIQEVEGLKDLMINSTDVNELTLRIENLETSVSESLALFNNTNEIVQMIDNVNTKIEDLINGSTNVTISYDSNIVRPGDGIQVDRRTPNRLRIINSNQEYNISNNSITDLFNMNTVPLGKFTNYVRHENSGIPIELSRDLEIYIEDRTESWKKGQVVRIVFADELIPGVHDVKIKTDYFNTANTGVYGVTIGVLNDLDFTPSGNMPIFEIICIDPVNFQFRVDKIR
jgi:hypothetical protein